MGQHDVSLLKSADTAATGKDLLKGRPDTIVIEVTSKCNLRCHYCIKADPAYDALPHVNTDMSDKLLDDLYVFCKENGTKNVSLSGVGETAMTAGWHRRLDRFLKDPDLDLYLVSNFVRPLSDDDLEALLSFHTLQVSFDSADMTMVRKLRSKADLGTISYNLVRMKQKIRARGRGPMIMINCTLSAENMEHLVDLAAFCRELGVDKLLVGEMMNVTPHNTFGNVQNLNHNEIGILSDQIARAKATLEGSETEFGIQDALAARVSRRNIVEKITDFVSGTVDSFRKPGWGSCLQPWSMPFVRSDGMAFACCCNNDKTPPIGDCTKSTMGEIFNGKGARDIRADILAGRTTLPCDTCTLAKKMPPREFAEMVRDWL